LIGLVRFYQAWRILRFDEPVAARFRNLKKQHARIGTLDLKIASIELEQDALVLSANTKDFGQVPNLSVEDWFH